ncbi:hypothetical protein BJ875DRAFT_505200 [Amylocarpus encephaloides]|uniref:DUF676 domain-containing protein n=1 Tax=Amylocarpus encephaloides TaxID=45428 RepID=A0A9P7YIG9_9HELO|nr:hypothetical protein BJ875DRAFT_505200 [Amylocarpus encephaloides]
MATSAQLAEKQRHEIPSSSQPSTSLAGAATSAQLSEKARNTRLPPALPPRVVSTQAPPPYTEDDAGRIGRSATISEQWRSHDPRSSSAHSLVPSESARQGRRTLLLVFIHGFMGNETSFQSFPAHIHNLLTITVSDSHLVHTKIYPRYKSRKNINFARDDFSKWLEPHEGSNTDVVLLGHSMGGILGTEVAMLRPFPPVVGKPLRHRILGTINFDTPFLGMHPGVIGAGLGSIFRPAPEQGGVKSPGSSNGGANTPLASSQTSISSQGYAPSMVDSDTASQISLVQSVTSPTANTPPNDSFFNPPFPNDIRLPERKGLSNLLHFINKHSDGLTSATKNLVMSHIEFGGVMADYTGLKIRYENIRSLEDVDNITRSPGQNHSPRDRRVRFINYYTASTGRPKPPKTPPTRPAEVPEEGDDRRSRKATLDGLRLNPLDGRSPSQTPSISVEEHAGGTITPRPLDEPVGASPSEEQITSPGENSGLGDDSLVDQIEHIGEDSGVQDDLGAPPEMQHVDYIPIDESEAEELLAVARTATSQDLGKEVKLMSSDPPLPPLPDAPIEPEPINLDLYTDKDSRKIAEKEYKRFTKAYQQAVKDRENAVKDRRKLIEKREKKTRQEQERQLKADEKQRLKEEKEGEKKKAAAAATAAKAKGKENERKASDTSSMQDDKPKRDKKFCMLPPKYGGQIDKCWVRIYMEGVDEVGAHCGLFFPGPQYESLVGNVGARIGKWVGEDATRRAITEAEMAD